MSKAALFEAMNRMLFNTLCAKDLAIAGPVEQPKKVTKRTKPKITITFKDAAPKSTNGRGRPKGSVKRKFSEDDDEFSIYEKTLKVSKTTPANKVVANPALLSQAPARLSLPVTNTTPETCEQPPARKKAGKENAKPQNNVAVKPTILKTRFEIFKQNIEEKKQLKVDSDGVRRCLRFKLKHIAKKGEENVEIVDSKFHEMDQEEFLHHFNLSKV